MGLRLRVGSASKSRFLYFAFKQGAMLIMAVLLCGLAAAASRQGQAAQKHTELGHIELGHIELGPALSDHREEESVMGVGVLGLSHIHRQDVLDALRAFPAIKVTAVWDASADLAAEVAGVLGSRAVTQAEEVLQDPGTQAVIIAGETALHPLLVRATAAAHKHLFVEKPLAMDLSTAKLLANEIAAAGVMFHTGFFLRELPAVQRLQELIHDKAFGEIAHLRITVIHPGRLQGWFEAFPWMLQRAQAGYGGFGDLGLHAFDLLHQWCGRPERVVAEIRQLPHSELDDYGEAFLRYKGGTLASVAAGWAEHGPFFQLALHASLGSASIIQGKLTYTLPSGTKVLEGPAPSASDGVKRFLSALSTGKRDGLVSLEDALASIAQLEDAYRVAPGWLQP